MAMSKKERARLERILQYLDRGIAYLDQDTTFVARKVHGPGAMAFSRVVTVGQVEHCIRSDSPLAYAGEQSISVIDKHIGSDLVLLRNARCELAYFLAPEIVESV
jgi:hypothetical protein